MSAHHTPMTGLEIQATTRELHRYTGDSEALPGILQMTKKNAP
jgi:hypothetical protein